MDIINKITGECQASDGMMAVSGGGGGGRATSATLPPGSETSLPCLYSNNATENNTDSSVESLVTSLSNVLSSYNKRQAETLYQNVARLISLAPSINHIGFVTLTFKDNVTDAKEAYRRFTSLNNHFFSPSKDFDHWVCVKEPQKRGAWHYHLVVILKQDIRTGFDFSEAERNKYSSASPYLRGLWLKLRKACSLYGFGRSQILPVRSNQEAMARYIGKYISKGIMGRSEAQKGVRLVSYSKGWLKNSVKFQWYTPGSKKWREKVSIFAAQNGCVDLYELKEKLGSSWAYKNLPEIFAIDTNFVPSFTVPTPYENYTVGMLSKKVEKKEMNKWQKDYCLYFDNEVPF